MDYKHLFKLINDATSILIHIQVIIIKKMGTLGHYQAQM